MSDTICLNGEIFAADWITKSAKIKINLDPSGIMIGQKCFVALRKETLPDLGTINIDAVKKDITDLKTLSKSLQTKIDNRDFDSNDLEELLPILKLIQNFKIDDLFYELYGEIKSLSIQCSDYRESLDHANDHIKQLKQDINLITSE